MNGEGSSNVLSSRGSTKATGEVDDLSNIASDNAPHILYNSRSARYPEEEEKEEDGSPILTNKYLRELFAKNWRQYYRTAYLNEKLYLHYKGFSYMKNLA